LKSASSSSTSDFKAQHKYRVIVITSIIINIICISVVLY